MTNGREAQNTCEEGKGSRGFEMRGRERNEETAEMREDTIAGRAEKMAFEF